METRREREKIDRCSHIRCIHFRWNRSILVLHGNIRTVIRAKRATNCASLVRNRLIRKCLFVHFFFIVCLVSSWSVTRRNEHIPNLKVQSSSISSCRGSFTREIYRMREKYIVYGYIGSGNWIKFISISIYVYISQAWIFIYISWGHSRLHRSIAWN